MNNTFRQEHTVFIFHSTLLNHFSGSKYIWKTNCLDKCSGTFVYMYYQRYALMIVTQPRNKECAIPLDRNTKFSFIIKFYRTIIDWV